MPKFMIGARGHDFGRQTPEQLFQAIGEAGFACTQLAYTKAIQGVSSYGDVTPALVAETQDAIQKSGVQAAVYGTYVELSYADEERRRAETAKVLGQIRNAKLLGSVCMGSETTSMSKQPGVTRREAQEALLRSLAEIVPACEEQGVLFGVECVYHHAMNTPEAVKMVLDTMASPNLRVSLTWPTISAPRMPAWTHSAGSGIKPPTGTATRSLRSILRARRSGRTAATIPPAWRTRSSTTPAALPCCVSCRRTVCLCCGRKQSPPVLPATSPLSAASAAGTFPLYISAAVRPLTGCTAAFLFFAQRFHSIFTIAASIAACFTGQTMVESVCRYTPIGYIVFPAPTTCKGELPEPESVRRRSLRKGVFYVIR